MPGSTTRGSLVQTHQAPWSRSTTPDARLHAVRLRLGFLASGSPPYGWGPFKNVCQLVPSCGGTLASSSPRLWCMCTVGRQRQRPPSVYDSCCVRVTKKQLGRRFRLFVPCDPADAGCLLAWSCCLCGRLCPPRRRLSFHFLEMGLTVREGGHGARRFCDAELPVRATIHKAGLTARAARLFGLLCILCVAGWTLRTSARASIRSAWA